MMSYLDDNVSRQVDGLREGALDFLIALGLNLIFVALAALLLWPLGKTALALSLAKGYGILWVATVVTAAPLYFIQRLFRIDVYSHFDAYLISNILHGVFLLAGWSAFAALSVRSFVDGVPLRVAAILWLVGFLSSFMAFSVLTSFYSGIAYKLFNAPLALISFLVFAVWTASGRALYGWFFNFF